MFLVFFIYSIIVLLFFHRMFLGEVPIPLDIIVGSYFPWLDYKWGYEVGVPVRNPVLTDVVSQLYIWRDLGIEMILNGELPLWNPYAFSGYPLLANYQSAILYPLNILMAIFGSIWGWSFMIVLQVFLSLIFMHIYLREVGLTKISSTLGGIVFTFSGFMSVWMEYNTLTQVGMWLPLLLFTFERFLKESRLLWLALGSLVYFFFLTAGSIQIAIYILVIYLLYALFRIYNLKVSRVHTLWLVFMFMLLGLGLSAIQLFPSMELFMNSIRVGDKYIEGTNYGLLPLRNIITFVSPDFFGNHVTGNFWGFHNYTETSLYFGVVSIPFLLISIFKRDNKIMNFWILVYCISLLMVFDNFLGRLMFILKIPVLSTSYASRAIYILDLSAAILIANGFQYINVYKKFILKTYFILFWFVIIVIAYILASLYIPSFTLLKESQLDNLRIGIRNMLLPLFLVVLSFFIVFFFKKVKVLGILIILLVLVDLIRFNSKYNTFSKISLYYPSTPVLSYVQENIGYYRVEREKTETLPPNSWIKYKLLSPSGYDPLYPFNYGAFYNLYNKVAPWTEIGRYAELDAFESEVLDLASVKYLVAAKRNDRNIIDKKVDTLSFKINNPKYKRVFSDGTVIVLENTDVLPRVTNYANFTVENNFLDALSTIYNGLDFKNYIVLNNIPKHKNLSINSNDLLEIKEYHSNEVIIKTKTSGNSILMLNDSYYPGWKVEVDDNKASILVADGVFRAVEISNGEHKVRFYYDPLSFNIGVIVSIISMFGIIGIVMLIMFRRAVFKNIKL